MAAELDKWYARALQQMSAESYLDRISDGDSPEDVLADGNTDVRRGVEPTGATRMTIQQARMFEQANQIVAHHANDATGFSATLLRGEEDGETRYTLSI